MKLALRVGVALVVVAATAIYSLIELDYWHTTTDGPGIAAIGVVAAVGFGQAIRGAVDQFRIDKSATFRHGVEEALGAALRGLVALPGVLSIENTGISAWMIRRRLRKPWQSHLVRVGERRLMPHFASPIIWTKGKGIIGQCWEVQNVVSGETEEVWAPYENCKKAAWKAAPAETRLKLTFKDFQRLHGKYVGAVAVPIMDGTTFVGCISVDLRPGHDWNALGCQPVVDIATQAGCTISNLLALVPRWVYKTHG